MAGLANLHSAEARCVALHSNYLMFETKIGKEPNVHRPCSRPLVQGNDVQMCLRRRPGEVHLLVSPRLEGSSSGAPLSARTMILKLRRLKIAA